MNISLPSPPIGDQIPTVPDAPWTASNLDLDLLIKEEIGFGCPRNGPRLPMEGHQMSKITESPLYMPQKSDQKYEIFKKNLLS